MLNIRAKKKRQEGAAAALSPRRLVILVGAGLMLLVSRPGLVASPLDADWPCIQRKVPEISIGQVWNGPPIDPSNTAWRDDPTIAEMAGAVASRRMPVEEAKARIARFAEGAAADKNAQLTALFAGIFSMINSERASIMAGIERYAKRQQSLAEKIERQTAELDRLPTNGSDAERARRAELEEIQAWDTRIFQERERSLQYVCEQPVILEQRAFALARDIMSHLAE
jgi:hypothetical protein